MKKICTSWQNEGKGERKRGKKKKGKESGKRGKEKKGGKTRKKKVHAHMCVCMCVSACVARGTLRGEPAMYVCCRQLMS